MTDYIERGELERELACMAALHADNDKEFNILTEVELLIPKIPSADVAPVVHGRWTEIDASYWRWKQSSPFPVHLIKYKHDKCGEVVSKKEDYCPGCGAQMDLGD